MRTKSYHSAFHSDCTPINQTKIHNLSSSEVVIVQEFLMIIFSFVLNRNYNTRYMKLSVICSEQLNVLAVLSKIFKIKFNTANI